MAKFELRAKRSRICPDILCDVLLFQLMAATQAGPNGHNAAGHAVQASSPVTVYVTTQYHHQEGKTAPTKDLHLTKKLAALYHVLQVVTGLLGLTGHLVPGRVVVVSSFEVVSVRLLLDNSIVLGRELSRASVAVSTVQVRTIVIPNQTITIQ